MSDRLLFISETEQIPTVLDYLSTQKIKPQIICFDFWCEQELHTQRVEFISVSDYFPPWSDTTELLRKSENFAREWYRIPEMAFFEHRGIRIAEALEPAVDFYVQRVFLLQKMFTSVLGAHPHVKEIVIPYTTISVSKTSGPFAPHEARVAVDVLEHLASQNSQRVVRIGENRVRASIEIFPTHSGWRTLALRMYNSAMSIFSRRRKLKIFASEYWSHIEPFIKKMNDTELILMDRGEARNISWAELLRHRMRFMHPLDEVDKGIRDIANEREVHFKKEWQRARLLLKEMPQLSMEGESLWPLVATVLDFMVETYAERVVRDIEAIRKILKREHINGVLVRASVSAQHHFFLLTKVAKDLEIPAVEVQHAGAMLDAHSSHSRLEASHLAAYGELTKTNYVRNHGYDPERICVVGSPRFDTYSKLKLTDDKRNEIIRTYKLDSIRPIILVVVPAEVDGLAWGHLNSYEIGSFLRSLRNLKDKIPDVQFIFKFRARYGTAVRKAYLRELFPVDIVITEYEDLFSLLSICDIVTSPNSTVLYEAMIGRKPVLFLPWKKGDPHLSLYEQGGTAIGSESELIKTVKRLIEEPIFYEETVEKGTLFLKNNYLFGGHSADRTVALLRRVIR